MKKLFCILLCLAVLFSLSACGKKQVESAAEQAPYKTEGWEYSYRIPVAEGYIATYKPAYDSAKGLWHCDRYSLRLDNKWEAQQVDMEAGGGWALYNSEYDVSLGVNIFDTAFDDEVFTADNIGQGMQADFGDYIQISSCEDIEIDGHKAVYLRAFVSEELQTWIIVFVNCDDCTYKFTLCQPFDEVDLESTVTNALLDGLRILTPED